MNSSTRNKNVFFRDPLPFDSCVLNSWEMVKAHVGAKHKVALNARDARAVGAARVRSGAGRGARGGIP